MGKYEILIKAVTVQHLSHGQVAALCGVSKTLVHKLHHRWLTEGDAALEPRSRRARSIPNRTPDRVRARVIELRDDLTARGLNAGADTIGEHLTREHITLSRATIWRILTAGGKVAPQPRKRPRSSWRRFAADRPNELWQSDLTHVALADATDTDVIGWLDDHSRYMLHLTAHRRVTGHVVTDTFTETPAQHGYPAATLTDNGMVYTTRLAHGGHGRGDGGGDGFGTLLATLGITQKSGKPYKPTTQGKIERFWQTLKKYLEAPRSLTGSSESCTNAPRGPGYLASALRHHRRRRKDHPPPLGKALTSRDRQDPRPHRDHLPCPQQRRHHHRPGSRRTHRRIHPRPRKELPTQKRLNPRKPRVQSFTLS